MRVKQTVTGATSEGCPGDGYIGVSEGELGGCELRLQSCSFTSRTVELSVERIQFLPFSGQDILLPFNKSNCELWVHLLEVHRPILGAVN